MSEDLVDQHYINQECNFLMYFQDFIRNPHTLCTKPFRILPVLVICKLLEL
jgi:hypothetical protein